MDETIRNLLDALEAAEAAGAPLTDTVIRESLLDVIYEGFIQQQPGYRVPDDLLLNYTEGGRSQNAAVVQAFTVFLERARECAKASGLDTPEQRERAFFDSEVSSSSDEFSVGSIFD